MSEVMISIVSIGGFVGLFIVAPALYVRARTRKINELAQEDRPQMQARPR